VSVGDWPTVTLAALASQPVGGSVVLLCSRRSRGNFRRAAADTSGSGFGPREMALEQQRLGPDEQVDGEHHDLQQGAVDAKRSGLGLRFRRVRDLQDHRLTASVVVCQCVGVFYGLLVRPHNKCP